MNILTLVLISGLVFGQGEQPVQPDVAMEINKLFENVRPMLEKKCADCHSANAKLPWYASVPLVGWLVKSDVEEGREHFEFSKGFPFGGRRTQSKILEDMKEVAVENEMPILIYTMVHWSSGMTESERDALIQFSDAASAKLQTPPTD